MMQTNGPVRDYARYANASASPFLRPQTSQEITESAVSIFRRYFSRILPLTLIPSLYISGFAVILFQMIFPRMFETEFAENQRSQVIEFSIILLIGFAAGTVAYALGTSQIAVIANEVVKAELSGLDLNTTEIERRCKSRFFKTFVSTLRVSWHQSGIMMVAVIPLVLAGFLLGITSKQNPIPGYLALISFVMIFIGAFVTLVRIGVGMISVSIAAEEQKTSGECLRRSKELTQVAFGRSTSNPAVTAAISVFLIYLLLLAGVAILNSSFDVTKTIVNWFSNTLVKAFVQTFLGLLPHLIVIVFVVPYLAITSSLNYYQKRIHLEGMDIETLFARLPASRR